MSNNKKTYHKLTIDRVFIDMTGSLDGALLLSYLFDGHQQANGDWFARTQAQCQQATGLKRARQENWCEVFIAQQWLEKKVAGLPASTYYRLNGNALQGSADLIQQEKEAITLLKEEANHGNCCVEH